MKYGSLFTGIGGFDFGFDQAGMQSLWQIEKDKDCTRVLSRHWPNVSRGRLVEEVTRQRFAGVIENVPGLRSSFANSHPPCDLAAGLGWEADETSDLAIIVSGLCELGYCVSWCELDSQYFHLPQRRERAIIVGSLGNGCSAQILFEPESVRGDPPPSRETGKRVAGTLESRAAGCGIPETSKSLKTCTGGIDREDGHTPIPQVAKALNAERDGYNDGSDQTYIPEVVGTLNDGAYWGGGLTGRTPTPDAYLPSVAWALQERDSKGVDSNTKEGHLIVTAQGGSFDVADPICAKRQSGTPQNGVGYGKESDPMFTLQSTAQHGVAQVQWASGGGQIENPTAQALRSGAEHNYQFARVGLMVRRLTPRECERLQGFPDDWTRFDADGKEISDSARYRMLGNAVSTTVAHWIGKQIIRFAS